MCLYYLTFSKKDFLTLFFCTQATTPLVWKMLSVHTSITCYLTCKFAAATAVSVGLWIAVGVWIWWLSTLCYSVCVSKCMLKHYISKSHCIINTDCVNNAFACTHTHTPICIPWPQANTPLCLTLFSFMRGTPFLCYYYLGISQWHGSSDIWRVLLNFKRVEIGGPSQVIGFAGLLSERRNWMVHHYSNVFFFFLSAWQK